jgi:hypothetical protein
MAAHSNGICRHCFHSAWLKVISDGKPQVDPWRCRLVLASLEPTDKTTVTCPICESNHQPHGTLWAFGPPDATPVCRHCVSRYSAEYLPFLGAGGSDD